jgi:iron complex transport system substrate-binding protein
VRIVSLLPSSSEIVSALGFGSALVGRSHECDHPAGVEKLPVCTEPKIDVSGTSREIDDRVKATLRDALSVYRVHGDLLKELQPDLIVTQSQCEVCAVSLKDVEKVVGEVLGSRPTLVSLEPNSLDDVWEDFHKVASALGVPDRGEDLVGRCQTRLAALAETAKHGSRPTVGCIEWLDPLMGAGNWIPTLVETAGGRNLFGDAGEHSPWMTWEGLASADPEVIVVLPCGFGIERSWAETEQLASRHEGWRDLRAVREGKVFITDGHHYFNRPGPRLVESTEILAEILHPDLFDFGHEGQAWRRFDLEAT